MIRNLPSRYPEIGRIRLGEKEVTDEGKERPKKGTNLRFTSNDEVALKALASQHGGDVVAWEKGEQTYQLVTESPFVPVLLPPDPVDTTYERWGSGGCQRRCDGERVVVPVTNDEGGYLEERDCMCIAEGLIPGERGKACSVTVRVRLVLPDVPGIGMWLCTSHSIYAAMELPGQAALLEAMRSRGALIPAEFGIEQRREKKPWERYAREFIVPVLRIRASLAELAGGRQITTGATFDRGPAHAPVDELEHGQAALPAAEPVKGEIVTPDPERVTSPEAKAAKPSPFVRAIQTAAKRAGMTDEQLAALIAEQTGRASLAEIADHVEANKVLTALAAAEAGTDPPPASKSALRDQPVNKFPAADVANKLRGDIAALPRGLQDDLRKWLAAEKLPTKTADLDADQLARVVDYVRQLSRESEAIAAELRT